MAATKSFTFVDIMDPTGPSNTIYQYLHIYDRAMFASSCKSCLNAFIKYLKDLPSEKQSGEKSFALRQFILKPGQDDYYPMTYLNELKKIDAVLYPSASPEFVGKLRKAFYEEDKLSMRILIDFGCDGMYNIYIYIMMMRYDDDE